MTRPSTLKGATRRAVEYLWWTHATWLSWFLAAAVAIWLVITVVAIGMDKLGGSVWEGAGLGWTRWVMFAAGIAIATQSLGVIVAHGRTRRSAVSAIGLTVLLLSVAGALVVTVVYGVEALVWNWQDVARTLQERHLFDSPGQFWLVALESFVVYLGFAASGWFVGLVYYRYRATVGTLLLPVGLLPVAAIDLFVSASMLPSDVSLPMLDTSTAVGVVVALVVIALAVWASATLQISTPLRPRPR